MHFLVALHNEQRPRESLAAYGLHRIAYTKPLSSSEIKKDMPEITWQWLQTTVNMFRGSGVNP